MTDLRAAVVHIGERERLDVVNNSDKKPFVEDEDSNPAAACPWALGTRQAGERNEKVVNLAQLQKSKFSIALSGEDIEADFTAITGAKPPRKPKNRPRAIQKEIDVIKSLNQNILIFTISHLNSNFLHTGFLQDIFPGSWLMEITLDKHKIPENPDH
ncbi:uncharacterized protein LOC116010841 [Ipomoea triloba]|uniref:uncharacterized protein LOC116010841 n=1 Tax=Ipomoea triloba TaxID=35885 RepID=UPI00125D94E7|nr:uncharacterized protein LOC116010841 [Ipomoea triloba]